MTSQTATSEKTPRIVRFAVWLTFFNTWVLFEETVVDRYGLWEYMPYYRVGKLCSWDIGAMVLIGFVVWWVFRGRKASTAPRRSIRPDAPRAGSS